MKTLVEELAQQGIDVWEESGTLVVRAARGTLTPIVKEQIHLHKNDILSELKDHKLPPVRPQVAQKRDQPIPLSFSQQRLWFIDQWAPGNPTYNMPGILVLTGELETGVLSRVFQEIFRRHEVLRTTFAAENGVPRQVIHPEVNIDLEVIDLPGTAPDSEPVRRLISEMTMEPFDLSAGPLTRLKLVRSSRSEHLMLFAAHHIVWDGWSLRILMTEIAALYSAFQKGLPSPLPELPVQYADYAIWQRECETHPRFQRQLEYWINELKGANTLLKLPSDRPRPPHPSFRGSREFITFLPDLVSRLRTLAADQNATLFMVLLAGFAVLLHRYTGQDDILIGSAVANRSTPETQCMAGYFANNVALRCDLTENPSFTAMIQRTWQKAVGMYENQDAPFERVVDAVNPEREAGRTPLFQVLFALQNASEPVLATENLTLRLEEADRQAAMLDLILSLWEIDGGLRGWLEFDCDIFERSTVARIGQNLLTLLRSAADNPALHISDLQLLTPAEQNQVLYEWNRTRELQLSPLLVHQMIVERANQRPEACAVVCAGQSLTYRQLNAMSNQVAHLLTATGLGRGDMVAIWMERGVEAVASMLGVLKAGGVYVPIEPPFPDDRVKIIARNGGVQRFIVDSEQAKRVSRMAEEFKEIEHCIVHESAAKNPQAELAAATLKLWNVHEFAQWSEVEPKSSAGPDDLAYVIYTSGSTGQPKGIVIGHAALLNLVEFMNSEFAIGAQDRALSVASFCFDLSVYDILGVLAAGGTVRLASHEELADPATLVSILQHEPVTLWNSAPAALQQLLPFLPAGAMENASLRYCLLSGDWIPLSVPPEIHEHFPGAQLIALGGATEATIWSNFFRVDEVNPSWSSIPYGKPISGAQYFILDSCLNPCPIGVPGDLYIAGDCLALGYIGEPILTARAFIPNPFTARAGDRMYKTGDRARYMEDGNIEFLGRLDHQVKLRGFRIELSEIESVIRQHSEVRDAIMVLRKDPVRGDRLIAYVVPKNDSISEAGLLSHLKQHLPAYMIPADIVFVDALPVTANGKVDRKHLPEPALSTESSGIEYVAPRNEVEKILAEMWCSLFGTDHISIHEDFFVMGGHSMLAARLVAQIQKRFGIPLSLQMLFTSTTIATLADAVQQAMIQMIAQLPDAEVEARLAHTTERSQM